MRRATELNPQHWLANLKLAEIITATRKKELLDEAADRIHKVLNAMPDNLEAADALAVTEIRQGNTAEAASRLEQTLKTMPAHLQSSVLLAELKLAQKDYKRAEEILQKAAAATPQAAPPALALAELYLLTGRPEDAEAQARKALARQPKLKDALWALAASQTARHELDAADRTYRELAALPDKRLRAVHALFSYRTGKRDAAVAEFQELFREYPDDRQVRTQLIAACLETNRMQGGCHADIGGAQAQPKGHRCAVRAGAKCLSLQLELAMRWMRSGT